MLDTKTKLGFSFSDMIGRITMQKLILILAICVAATGLLSVSGYSTEMVRSALNGDPDAQYSLGWAYYHGEGVVRDLREAVRWYALAAEQGHADAQCNLGWCYYRGEGVSREESEAADGGGSPPGGEARTRSIIWAGVTTTVLACLRTRRRPSNGTASQPARAIRTPSATWATAITLVKAWRRI